MIYLNWSEEYFDHHVNNYSEAQYPMETEDFSSESMSKNVQKLLSCAKVCMNQSARLAQSAQRMSIEQWVFFDP
jgi:hypothetical protein